MSRIQFLRGGFGSGSPETEDSERRHASHIEIGVVRQARYNTEPVAVRVAIGDEGDADGSMLTDWLPFAAARAGGNRDWDPPEIGEAVIVLAPSGELENGIVLPASLYTDEYPAPGDKAGLWRKIFGDGASIEYDRDAGTFQVDAHTSAKLKVGSTSALVSSDSIVLTVGGVTLTVNSSGVSIAGGNLSVDGDASATGTVTGTTDVVGGGKSLKGHKHTGVQTGGGVSGAPQ